MDDLQADFVTLSTLPSMYHWLYHTIRSAVADHLRSSTGPRGNRAVKSPYSIDEIILSRQL